MTFFDPNFHPGDGYHPVPRHWSRDPRLRYTDKGLLMYWASHEPGYKLTIKQIIAESADGKDAVYASIERLVQHGYLVSERVQGAGGRFERFEYRWGPSAISQQYVRNWGTEETAGETTSGKPGSGENSSADQGKDVSAGETTSGFSGSGKPASGKPATKKTKIKNTKESSSPLPPPQPVAAPLAAEAEEEELISEPETPAAPANPDLEKAVEWFATRSNKWKPDLIRETLIKAMDQRQCTLPEAFYPLRALAKGEFGSTWSPARLLADGPWWAISPPREAPGQSDPYCSKKPTHAVYRAKDCPLCADEATGAGQEEANSVHPDLRQQPAAQFRPRRLQQAA